MNSSRLVPAIVMAITLPGFSAAADPDEETTRLDKVVVVASKVERPLREVAGIVDSMDAVEIENRMVRDVDDLLRFESGISVSRDPGRFSGSTFSIRGVGGNRVVTEIDGVPVPDGFLVGDFSNAGRDVVDPGILRTVEILRGPASALYGSDALGGVLAFTTMDPQDLYGSGERHVSGRLGHGSADDSVHLNGYYASRGEVFDLLAVASQREGGELDAEGATANPADYRNTSALVKLVRYSELGEAMRLTLDVDDADRQTDVQSLVGGQGRYASTTKMKGDDSARRLRLSLAGEVSAAGFLVDDAVWRLYYQESDVEQLTLQEIAPGGMTPYPSRRDRRFEYSQEVYGGEFTAEKLLATSSEQRVVYGVEIIQTTTTELRDATLTNLSSGETSNTILGETFPLRDFPISDTTEVGVYVQDEITTGDWTLIPALRYEHYRLEPREDRLYETRNPGASAVSLTESELTPRLGIVRQLGANDSIYVQYARGFRAPPFEDANIGLDIPMFNIRAIPNPDLEPERSDSLEIGWRHDDGVFATETGLFYTELDNLIESRAPLGPDPDTGVLLFQSVNRDEARIHGAELRGLWRAGRQFDFLRGIEFEAAASISRGVDTARDEWLNSIDPDSLVLATRYLPESSRWNVELVWTLVDDKQRVDEPTSDYFQPAGHGVIDLFARLDAGAGWTLRAGVDNLMDKRYWRWSDVRGLAADDPLIPLYARPGRNFRLDIHKVF